MKIKEYKAIPDKTIFNRTIFFFHGTHLYYGIFYKKDGYWCILCTQKILSITDEELIKNTAGGTSWVSDDNLGNCTLKIDKPLLKYYRNWDEFPT